MLIGMIESTGRGPPPSSSPPSAVVGQSAGNSSSYNGVMDTAEPENSYHIKLNGAMDHPTTNFESQIKAERPHSFGVVPSAKLLSRRLIYFNDNRSKSCVTLDIMLNMLKPSNPLNGVSLNGSQ